MIAYIDSSDIIPIDTHNLKDSTGWVFIAMAY